MPVDTERFIGFAVLGIVMLSVAGIVVNEILKTVLRARERMRSERDRLYEERLARLEAAVDAVAVEVERQGEMLRYTARLDPPPKSDQRLPGRTITPH